MLIPAFKTMAAHLPNESCTCHWMKCHNMGELQSLNCFTCIYIGPRLCHLLVLTHQQEKCWQQSYTFFLDFYFILFLFFFAVELFGPLDIIKNNGQDPDMSHGTLGICKTNVMNGGIHTLVFLHWQCQINVEELFKRNLFFLFVYKIQFTKGSRFPLNLVRSNKRRLNINK